MAANSEFKHNAAVMQKVYKFYNNQKFTDVLFEFPFTNYTFTAHRLILSAASPYLLEFFDNEEPACSSVTITTIDSDTFEQLVTFCYNGQTDITAGNAERMLRGATLLQLDGVIEVCVSYMMDNIDSFLVRKLIALEAETKCKSLELRLLDYIAKNFKTVNKNGEIFGITPAQWKVMIDRIDINEVSQADLFWAIKSWYEYNSSLRQQQLVDVVGFLNLTEFEPDFILKQIKPLPGCEKLANEALKKRADMVTTLAIQTWEESSWTGPKYILRFDQAKEEWEKTIKLDIKRYSYSTAFVGDTIYFVGGQSVFGINSEVQCYNIRTKEFSTKTKMQERRVSFCMAAWGQYIYTIGGVNHTKTDLSSAERYDPSTDRWEYVASMPTRRKAPGVTIYNNEIYIIGGKQNVTSMDTVECYNPATNRWRTCKSMIKGRANPAVTVHQDYIYAIGRDIVGRSDSYSTSVERYDPKRNEWTMIASLNILRRYVCAVSIGNQLFAIGGITGPQKFVDSVEVYDMANDKWLTKRNLPVAGLFQCENVPTNLADKL
ncbi:kelch-like protein 5 [Eurosta solidaginis]|uniref:kelch-like protein 5 n=1 Tax=Eurosta solidaginis TaxID=178769 RepID=UPI0035307B0C